DATTSQKARTISGRGGLERIFTRISLARHSQDQGNHPRTGGARPWPPDVCDSADYGKLAARTACNGILMYQLCFPVAQGASGAVVSAVACRRPEVSGSSPRA